MEYINLSEIEGLSLSVDQIPTFDVPQLVWLPVVLDRQTLPSLFQVQVASAEEVLLRGVRSGPRQIQLLAEVIEVMPARLEDQYASVDAALRISRQLAVQRVGTAASSRLSWRVAPKECRGGLEIEQLVYPTLY